MIKGYEIKKINNEEVLYLFLDFSLEFAKTKEITNKTTINKEIDKYIKDKKIKFNGRKICIMASGLMLGMCLLKSPLPKKYEDNLSYNYTTSIVTLEDNNFVMPEIKHEEEKTVVQDEKTEEVKKEVNTSNNTSSTKNTNSTTTKKANIKTTTSTAKKTTSNKTSSTKTTTSTNKKTTNNTSNNKTASSTQNKNTSTSKTPAPIKTMVTVNRSNGSVVKLELEEYLIGVVASEMPASFHTEALKAQAIAARTYALKCIEEKVSLTDTESTQVYKDNKQLKAQWGSSYNTYYNKIKNAVNATSGMVMKYNGTLIRAYYSSTSNGYSEDSSFVFGEFPYLKSVSSEVDKQAPSYLRTVSFTYKDISNKLGVPITPLSKIKITRNNSKRVDTIIIDNNTYSGVNFRKILKLRSTDFDISLKEDNVTITTRGYGHGVGMSQYGAHYYAKAGWSYSKILKHYYTGITISKY